MHKVSKSDFLAKSYLRAKIFSTESELDSEK
ncbi:MAG: hypothetical protein ACJAUY_000928 [Cognaticolwellia sp.]|jgi:hypothetical protein